MKSVKGLTWGTPEFIEIAKRGEIEGIYVGKEIEKLDSINFEKMYEVNLLDFQKETLREVRNSISDVLGEYACYGECEDFK